MDDTGYHYIIDMKVRQSAILQDAALLKAMFSKALHAFTVIGHDHYKFEEGGQGVTGFFLLSESHCSYHTYPENNYIAIDVFTCGRDPSGIADELAKALGSVSYSLHFLKRGSTSMGRTHQAHDHMSVAA